MNTAELCCKLNELMVMPHSDGSLRLGLTEINEETDEETETVYEQSGHGRMGFVDGHKRRVFIWQDGEAQVWFDDITVEWWPAN